MPLPKDETGFDQTLSFTLPDRDARGRAVRLGPVLDEILSAHDYPPAIRHLLAETLVLTALMGGLLKDKAGQLTVQAQSRGGPVELLVCDYRNGELRGYVLHNSEKQARLGANPSLAALFGKGHLAVTFDLAEQGQRYQGIVPLEGDSIAQACEAYFLQSEQVPTLIRVGVKSDGSHCIAGGVLVQHLPEGEEGRDRLHAKLDHPQWEHVSILAGSLKHDELIQPNLSMEALIWRLFHEEREVRVQAGASLCRGCRCSADHYRDILKRFPEQELAAMRDEEGAIAVDCAFCSRLFPIVI